MKSTIPTPLIAIGLLSTFLTLGGFLGWKIFVASEREVSSAEIQKRMEITAQAVLAPSNKDNPDDDLRLYAVNVIHTPLPFRNPFIGYGVYLGQGAVLTAAHVVGRLPFITHPRVLISGMDLPAKVVKEGSTATVDLALLSVDQSLLPYSLRLRRNLICNMPLQVGTDVIVVYPQRTVRSKIISPLQVDLAGYPQFNTLINEAEGSGSGVFDSQRKCLLGIISRRVEKKAPEAGRINFAGYFVSANAIIKFISTGSH